MEEKLKETVEKIVSAIFDAKEEETMSQKTHDALQASATKLEELQSVVAEKEHLLETAATEVEFLKEEALKIKEAKEAFEVEKTAEIATLVEDKKVLTEELEKVSLELSTMKKELLAEARMQELSKEGVLREDASVQKMKIMDMSDEDFTAYKEELVSIKTQVLAALAQKTAETTEEVIIPAKVDPDQAAQAALNLESAPSQTLAEKYQELGKAMAEAIKRK